MRPARPSTGGTFDADAANGAARAVKASSSSSSAQPAPTERSVSALPLTDWVAVGGIAQLVAAAATITLAIFTAVMASRTREVAIETQSESSATRLLAEEAKRDRELAARAQLSLLEFACDVLPHQEPPGRVQANILNAGSGPAIDVKLALRSPSDVNIWSIVNFRDLKPAGNREKGGQLVHGGSPYDLFDDPGDTAAADVVLFCSDVLDRRYRFPFLDAVGNSDATWRPLPPEIFSPDDPVNGRPNWVNHPKLWATPEWPVRPRSVS